MRRTISCARHGLSKALRFEALEPRQLLAVTTAVQSGSWDSPDTWSNGVPDANLRAVIPTTVNVTLDGVEHIAQELVIQGVLDVVESSGTAKTLTSDWIHVNSGGVFQIGTEANRYDENDFILTLTGEDPSATFTVEGAGSISNNNAFLMVASGGRLQFFGDEKLTYTKLSETANIGATQIRVEAALDRDFDGDIDADDGSVNWEVGDQIVIASSSRDYREEEVRLIQAISNQSDGTFLLTLDAPLANRHYGEVETYHRGIAQSGDFNADGVVNATDLAVWQDRYGENNELALQLAGNGSDRVDGSDFLLWQQHFGAASNSPVPFRTWDIDMRAEVAILNRNVRIQGLASHDTDNEFGDRARFDAGVGDGFAGHTMIMASAGQITLDSVQFDRMGQTGRLGRYPLHWHLAGDRTGDILRGASVTNSNNRGVTVHGTHNLLIEDVVLHDVHGHGFFMEDGVETGNQYLANIAFGIHKVGRSEEVGDFAPDLNDPFIVDTHDHVGQNANRFLSSSSFWITNPDNTWIGNISAGSEGTGFWFILPEEAIGASASDSQYIGVDASRTNLRQFDHNSSHSSPAGLNFDRGSDVEVPVGAPLKAFFDGDEYRPPQEPQINHYTAYHHRVGVYHRGQIANFHENRYADNFTSTFITFTQRITDTLYVGNSRGNADTSQPVTGHTIYDGANTLDGIHFAGYADSNAHTFRTHSAANRFTSHVFSDVSYEDDGSGNHVSVATQQGGANHTQAVGGFSPAAMYDVDGTLTGHVGGGAGSTVVTNHPFFYDANDFQPEGWNAWVSDDLYAQLLFQPNNANAAIRVTSPDGDAGTERNASFNTHVKTNDGDYVVDFPDGVGSIAGGFELKHFIRVGPNNGSTVIRFEGIGNLLAPIGITKVSGLTALRNATSSAYEVVGSDLWVKFFSASNGIDFVPTTGGGSTPWEDESPLSGTSVAGTSLAVNTVDGLAATGDGSRGLVGEVVLNGVRKFENINGGTFDVASQRGMPYSLSADYFVPVGTTLDSLPSGASPDLFYLQINFDGNNTASAGFVGADAAGTGWNTITLTGNIPAFANTTQPFFVMADGGFGAGQPNGTGNGVALYLDNIRFTIGTPLSAVQDGAIAAAAASLAGGGQQVSAGYSTSLEDAEAIFDDPRAAEYFAAENQASAGVFALDRAFAQLSESVASSWRPDSDEASMSLEDSLEHGLFIDL